ncbi:Integrase, catalytic core [Cucumis melo var. makuwa]|uniref:Integrase, catalytic core n=1 Tax=Cucumis melo var. makuwa TaxID=1194695 RepID=A0A5A7TP23_CUCMM|nr:Integrase, catalytic core [Cucumis melo var. makuwa]TYK12300.1 Integrase, catalytic core [Cucumis melo var. makuwa]
MNTQNLNHVPASVVFLVMAQNVKSSLGNELAQFAPTSATSDQRSISDGSLEPTPDTLPRRSTRVRESPIHLQDYHCFSTIVALVEPTSYQKASTDPLWQKAMNDELQALEKTHTWDYVDLPPSKRPIDCKWIYKIKTHSDGTIECYKARLVAKGYSQEYGIDYEETFAPVARMMSVRSLLAVAAVKQWSLLQMDVKNAFLNGSLFEEVYMKPPPGTSSPPHKGIVLLLLYVDDIIITGNDPQAISDLQHYLGQHFEMKDLRSLNYFLGLEVSRPSDGYLLSQAKYASDLLARLGITDSNTASTSLDPNIHLTLYDGVPFEDVSLYRQLVGSLIYLTVTRQTLHMLFTLLANLWLLLEPSILLPYYISFAISRGLWGMDFSFLLNHLSYYLAILMQIRLGIPLIGVLQQATAST